MTAPLPTLAALILLASHGLAAASCRAIDGDTLACGSERVRIRAIDAPEMRDPGGPDARAALAEMIRGRTLEWMPGTCDRYGRTLADVRASGRGWRSVDLGAAMMQAGHAWRFTGRTTARPCR